MICNAEQVTTTMPGYLYWMDLNHTYLGCNKQMAELLGTVPECVVGKRNCDLTLKPGFLEILNQNNTKTIESNELSIFQEFFDLSNGEQIVLLSHKQPIVDSQKKIIGLINVSIEITNVNKIKEQLKAERDDIDISLDNILGNLPGNIWWLNRNNIFLGCNNSQARMAGLKSRHDIVGKTNLDMPWKDQAENLNQTNNFVMETGQEFTVEETALVGDQEITYLSKKVPFYDMQGKIIGTMGVAFDISERKRMEHDLKIAKEGAEISNKAKTEFFENMKHDIRTPLSGIVGLSELIQYEEDPEKMRNYITQLVQSSRELSDFLNNILDSINIATGEIPLVKKRFELREVLEKVVGLHQSKAAEKKLALELIYDINTPKYLIGDPIRVYRIILEMLGNSLKFTQQGYVKVSAKAIKTANETIVVQIEIEDTGPGVALEKQQELFIRFKRLIPSYHGIYKGTGLGLSIVKQFIDDLQGEVYYSDREGGGAKFIALIPFKPSLLADDADGLLPMSSENDFLL